MAKIQHWMLAKSYLEDELRSLIQRLQPGRALNHDVPARAREVKQLRGAGRRRCLSFRYWGDVLRLDIGLT